MDDILRLSGIGMNFDGKWVLRDVNFSVRRGEFVILSGPNGSGKTTLLRIMLRLMKPTVGKVEYFNHEGCPTGRLPIGYLPQKNKIDTRFPITAEETILSGLRRGIFGHLPEDWREKLDKVVELCGTRSFMQQPIGTLSGGQLQRTLLARAIICEPELLVLDEPLSYVDKQFEHRIYEMLRELAKRMTILLVSHELTGLLPLADRTISIAEMEHEISNK